MAQSSTARARSVLTREALLDAGFRIACNEDLGALTICKLADQFDVTPMAVYRHFGSKAEIVDGVLDRFIREAAVTKESGDPQDWETWVRRTMAAMRAALRASPGVIPLLGTSYSLGPGGLGVLDQFLGVLEIAGLNKAEAVEGFLACMSFLIGSVTIESAIDREAAAPVPESGDSAERQRIARLRFEASSSVDYPRIVDSAAELARIRSERPFARGLSMLLEGLRRRAEAV